MVRLQMAPYPDVDAPPSYNRMTTARLPVITQEGHSSQASKPHSKLELMKSEFQQKLLREKEEKLVTMYNQQQEAALSKVRNPHYYPQYPPASKQTQPEVKALSSASSQSRYKSYGTNEDKISPSSLPAKKSTGIDRACPLKPVYYRKASSLNSIFNMGDSRSQRAVEHTSDVPLRPSPPTDPLVMSNAQSKRRSPGLRNVENPPPSPASATQPKRPTSNPSIMQQVWVQRQTEQEEETLEKEIRRKEAILREKLRRTEEELRRIQREREQVAQDERKERERQEKRRRAAEMEQEARLRRETMEQSFRETFHVSKGYEDNQVVRNRGDARIQGARRNTTELYSPTDNNNPPYLYEHSQHITAERLRKERLVTSNSKIRDRESLHSTKALGKIRDRESPHSTKASEKIWNLEESASSFSSSTTGHGRPSPSDYLNPRVRGNESTGQTPVGDMMGEFSEASSDEDDGYKDGEELPDQLDLSSNLARCSFCGRKFVVDRLEKHKKICKKNQNSKRKVFDSSMARAKGTDLEKYINRKSQHREQPKKNTWRQKHESFIRMLRQAREVEEQIQHGGKLCNLPPEENPDYIQCPHCNRRFAPKVAERHIPKCETIKSRPPPPPGRRK